MVEQHKKDHMENAGDAGRIVPADLDSSEAQTVQLFDTLPSGLPDPAVDNMLLQTAAETAANTGAGKSDWSVEEGSTNVIPLYKHESAISFWKMMPKMFVAASVLILAVVVVPLVDRMDISGGQIASDIEDQTTASALVGDDSDASAVASIEEASIIDAADDENVDVVLDQQSENTGKDEEAEAVLASAPMSGTDVSQAASQIDAAVSVLEERRDAALENSATEATPESPEAMFSATLAADSVSGALNEPEPVESVTKETMSDESSELAIAADTSNDASSSAADRVARTTIISTEASIKPNVVQRINVSSAARVQREIDTAEDSTDSVTSAALESNEGIQSRQLKSESNNGTGSGTGGLSASEENVEITPAYRSSLHRWKAEILKLSRLNKLEEAREEYQLYAKAYPDHLFEFNTGSNVEEGAQGAVTTILPAETTSTPGK